MPFDPRSIERAAMLAAMDGPADTAESNASVQTPPRGLNPAWYALPAIGQGVDAATTLRNFGNGYGEANAVYGSGQPVGRVLATKIGMSVALPLLMKALANHGHPTAAKTLGVMGLVGGAVPAAINLSQR